MKKKRKSLLITFLLAFITALSLSAFSSAIFSAISAAMTINNTPSFQVTVDDNTFYCYKTSKGARYIAVGWGEAPVETPDNLTVPEKLTFNGDQYTVVAIARSGFSRCDFKQINLPDSIEEIREGAFAYCEKLTSITIPPLVDNIAASTFVSCRALTAIAYKENIGTELAPVYAKTSTNEKIKRIEDHAFDSCVSLIQFECPKSLIYIGKCAFQNCNKITRFYLPSKSTSPDYGNVTIDSYAFADCSSLIWVYFEENLTTVNKYAFVDCHTDLEFHFGYDISGGTKSNPEFDVNKLWRKKTLKQIASPVDSDFYNYDDTTHSIIISADGYPGLKIGIDSKDVYLDSYTGSEGTTNKIKIVDGTQGSYAVIYQWDNPGMDVKKSTDSFYYYRYGTGKDGSGILTIPHSVTHNGNTYPVRVIAAEAFKESKVLKEIHFANKEINGVMHGVAQIQNKAFLNCTYIDTIDFDGVTTLKEISHHIFIDANGTKMTSFKNVLKLPACLQYVGPYAFANFNNATGLVFQTASDVSNSREPNLKVIGKYAFANIGESLTGNDFIHITLPCSLHDNDVGTDYGSLTASMNEAGANWAAVGPNAFGTLDGNRKNRIASVTMAPCGHSAHSSYYTSIACNAFRNSAYLVRFTSNENLCMIGSNAFSSCSSLKEVFLRRTKANTFSNNTKYVWGTADGSGTPGESMFGGEPCPHLVIFVDGAAPGNLDTMTSNNDTTGKARWNSEQVAKSSFSSGLGFSDADSDKFLQGRRKIPTYYSVNFSNINKDSIIYYSPSTKSTLSVAPNTTSEFYAGVITFVKEGSKYTAAHYYTNATNAEEEIDLTGITHTYSSGGESTTINISNNLTKIGPEAFASDRFENGDDIQATCPGRYFILPSSVTTISERAFFRRTAKEKLDDDDTKTYADYLYENGVAIVTTDSGSGPIGGINTDEYTDVKTKFGNKTYVYGYCDVPNVTRIENGAFFNNNFKNVRLSNTLAYLGRSAFFNRYESNLDTISFSNTNSNFSVQNGGIYYTAVSTKQTLVYQPQNITATPTNPLSIYAGTVAIGPGAVANTKYTSVDLPSTITHIYGSAFQNNRLLTEVTGGANLEYISANPYKITGYKIEKYKYFVNTTSDHDDTVLMRAKYGRVPQTPGTNADGTNTKAPNNSSITVAFKDEGTIFKLWPFGFTGGSVGPITLYGNAQTLGKETLIYYVPSLSDETDVLSSTDASLPFEMVDYRETLNASFAATQNVNSAFKDCKTLTKFDFTTMTNLKKIGYGAFKNCENLTNTTLSKSYNFYQYDNSTHTVSIKENNKTSKVLDLSQCTNLVSIGYGAFNGCTNIEYAILPYTEGWLFVGGDPFTPWYGPKVDYNSNNGNTVFSNNNINILIGDKEIRANNAVHGTGVWYGGMDLHYPTKWYGTNKEYYYTPGNGEKDLYKKQTSIRYWTNVNYDQDGKYAVGYLLFENYNQANDYFTRINAGSTINWPSAS